MIIARRLFDSGLIYRSDYLVNWSCVLQSAISDIEVEHLDVQARTDVPVPGYEQPVQFGALTKFAYKLCEMGNMTCKSFPSTLHSLQISHFFHHFFSFFLFLLRF